MKKIKLVLTCFLLMFGFWTTSGILNCYAFNSDYLSWHQESYLMSYCNSNSQCFTSNINGFKNIYNMNDPKVLCGLESGCATVEKKMITVYSQTDYRYFRLFIPPGTTFVGLSIYVPRDGLIAAQYRWGNEPQETFSSSFSSLPRDREYTYLKDIKDKDALFANPGGTIAAISNYLKTPLNENEAGWLYVKMNTYGSGYVYGISFTLEVSIEQYNAWYNNVNWSDFGDATSLGSNAVAPVPSDSIADRAADPVDTGDIFGFGDGTTIPTDGSVSSDAFSNPFANLIQNNPSTPTDTTTPVVTEGSADSGAFGVGDGMTIPGSETATPLNTQPLAPEYLINLDLTPGQWVLSPITLAQLGQRETVVPKLRLKFNNITPGDYEHYAALEEADQLFLAQKERLGSTVFTKYYHGEDHLKSYETVSYNGSETQWDCDVFALLSSLNFSPDYLANNPVNFYVGIAPKGNLDLNAFRGAVVSFTP